jgi:hypothetical protein
MISHSIASYIIFASTNGYGEEGKLLLKNTCRITKECAIPQHIPPANISYYTKPTSVNSGIRKKILFAKHEKKGRCFFAKGSKEGTYVDFMHHKEIYYINVHTNT